MLFERLRQLSAAHERLKHRIHNFRMPIRNKRTLLFVKCIYGTVPIVLGYCVMQLVAPDQKALEEKLRAMEARDPEGYAQARRVAEANRRQLQEVEFASQMRVRASRPICAAHTCLCTQMHHRYCKRQNRRLTRLELKLRSIRRKIARCALNRACIHSTSCDLLTQLSPLRIFHRSGGTIEGDSRLRCLSRFPPLCGDTRRAAGAPLASTAHPFIAPTDGRWSAAAWARNPHWRGRRAAATRILTASVPAIPLGLSHIRPAHSHLRVPGHGSLQAPTLSTSLLSLAVRHLWASA
jgi:hypothetical protein